MARNFTESELLEAVKSSGGVVDYIAGRLGCSWDTARKYIAQFPTVQDAIEIERCKFHAVAYSKFNEAIKSGERWALERVLDTSARRNGHGLVQHQQVDHRSEDGSMSPTRIEIVAPRITQKPTEG
jgi:hypothetical protein